MRYRRLLLAAVASVSLLGTSAAYAEETTTTTTTRTENGDPGVTVGVPGVVGVHIGGDAHPREGCVTKQATHTNEETGDTVTHKTTNCD